VQNTRANDSLLRQVHRACPGQDLHLVMDMDMDSYAVHKHPEVRSWLDRTPQDDRGALVSCLSWLADQACYRDATVMLLRLARMHIRPISGIKADTKRAVKSVGAGHGSGLAKPLQSMRRQP
jgi:hypothetical protein